MANGKGKENGIDYSETFSPIVKPTTICIVLSLVVTRKWAIHQLDVRNAFLHGNLQEMVYMHQPFGFVDSSKPKHVCLFRRFLYGLKQAPRAWYHRFATYLLSLGFINSKSDPSLFIFHRGSEIAYLLLYIDNIILTCSSDTLRQKVIKLLSSEFAMKDLGSLLYFLGIAITRTLDTMFLCQQKYAQETLAREDMSSCKVASTLVDTNAKLSAASGKHVVDPTS